MIGNAKHCRRIAPTRGQDMKLLYVLTDIAREYVWTGKAFLAVSGGPYQTDEIRCFRTRAQAEEEAARQRTGNDCHLKPARAVLRPGRRQGAGH